MFSNNRHFRIWSTSACNARCYYCFEKGIPHISMTENTANAAIAFICNLVNEGDTVSIEWFGGEPLVNTHIIDYISLRLEDVFKKKNVKWHASMVTNGSLFSSDSISKCKKIWNIKNVQITLDGFSDDYNQIKGYVNPNQHNFFTVIERIKMLAQYEIRVSIRMNYDTVNFLSLKRLIEFLHIELKKFSNISYYIYPVWDSLGSADNTFHTKTEADRNLLELLEMLVKYGMGRTKSLARLKYRKHQCSACGVNNYSILPNGDISKCSESFEHVVGNVFSGLSDVNLANKWLDTGLDEDCKMCNLLPLCQGGCRASRVTRMPRCTVFKDLLPDLLRWHVKHLEMQSKYF